jgi:dihydroflavonol-4-reductase
VPDALVTGASGFIGGALARALLNDGRSVRAFVRDPTTVVSLAERGAQVAAGDLLDRQSLVRAATGCDAVFHAAGSNGMCLRDRAILEDVNVGGTVAVVRACAEAGVRRLVYTSSGAAIGEPAGVIGTEGTQHRGHYLSAYERSKHLAEVAALDEAERLGVDLVAVNPSSVQGPGRSGGSARLIIRALRPGLRLAVRTRVSLVSIGDCVEAHLLAERRGRPLERYLISGWSTTTQDVLATLERVTGRSLPVAWVPGWAATAAGTAIGSVWRVAHRDAPFCRETARVLLHGHAFDASKAERDLGLTYTPPEEWLAETVEWYEQQGLV